VAGLCQHGNEPSDSIKGTEFVDYMNDYWILKVVSAPWGRSVGRPAGWLAGWLVGCLVAWLVAWLVS
jgi:hypothetical protein